MSMTTEDVREELDAFGTHIVVYIANGDGRLFEVHSVESGTAPDGTVCAVVNIGEKAN